MSAACKTLRVREVTCHFCGGEDERCAACLGTGTQPLTMPVDIPASSYLCEGCEHAQAAGFDEDGDALCEDCLPGSSMYDDDAATYAMDVAEWRGGL